MAAYIEWRERRKRLDTHRIGRCPSFYVELMESPLPTEPKSGNFLPPCQSSDSVGMDFKLLGDLSHCICLIVTVFHKSPIRFVTNDNKLVIKNFLKISKMSLKTAILARPEQVLFDTKYCHSPTEMAPHVTCVSSGSLDELTWTRFFKPEITDNLRLARPAPRPPFQGPVSIACPDHAR